MAARKSVAARKQKAKRARLTRQRIIQAAITYADRDGVDQLSMRLLAAELGCGVMSLYNHVRDKDDLIEGMVDAVAKEIELPIADGEKDAWVDDLRLCCTSAYKVMLKHHWAPKSWGKGNGPFKNDYHEALLRVLRKAGFSEELACRGYHALTMHVVGFSLQVLEIRPIMDTKKKVRTLGAQVLEELSEERYPYMREHIRFHMSGKDQRNDFKYILSLILEGLERDKASDSFA